MSGIRQVREVICPGCGSKGRVEFGMAMIQGRDDARDFQCKCGKTLRVEGQRAILNMKWSEDDTEGRGEKTVLVR